MSIFLAKDFGAAQAPGPARFVKHHHHVRPALLVPRGGADGISGISWCPPGEGSITATPPDEGWCKAADCLATLVQVGTCPTWYFQACAPLYQCDPASKKSCLNPAMIASYGLYPENCSDAIVNLLGYCRSAPSGSSDATATGTNAATGATTQVVPGTADWATGPSTLTATASSSQSTLASASQRNAHAAAGHQLVFAALMGIHFLLAARL